MIAANSCPIVVSEHSVQFGAVCVFVVFPDHTHFLHMTQKNRLIEMVVLSTHNNFVEK